MGVKWGHGTAFQVCNLHGVRPFDPLDLVSGWKEASLFSVWFPELEVSLMAYRLRRGLGSVQSDISAALEWV